MERVLALGQDMALLWTRYAPLYLSGVVNTLLLAVAATVLGCLIGLACGLLNTIPIHPQDRLPRRVLLRLLRAVIRIYVEVFRGTPMVLQAVFLYYGLPYFTNNAMRFDNVWAAALLVVSINTGAYMAESVRGGILSGAPFFLPPGHKSEPCRAVCCSGKTPRNVFLCMGHGPSSRKAAKCSLEP